MKTPKGMKKAVSSRRNKSDGKDQV